MRRPGSRWPPEPAPPERSGLALSPDYDLPTTLGATQAGAASSTEEGQTASEYRRPADPPGAKSTIPKRISLFLARGWM